MENALLAFQELAHLMARLRGPDGCPWDKKQTWQTLVPFTLEEAYEVAEAVETANSQSVRDELGDLLFHIFFYSHIAEEADLFSLEDVVRGVVAKMTRRHPHLFGQHNEPTLPEAHEVPGRWEEIKRQEKNAAHKSQGESGPVSVFDDINSHLPALLWAAKVQRKMGQLGFDWKNAEGVMEKCREEMDELNQALRDHNQADREEALGDLFFTLVNLAQHMTINPETALRKSTRKFQTRFRTMETRLHQSGQSVHTVSLEHLESLWIEAKIALS